MLRIMIGIILIAAAFIPTPLQGGAGPQQAIWTVFMLFVGFRVGFWGLKAVRKGMQGNIFW